MLEVSFLFKNFLLLLTGNRLLNTCPTYESCGTTDPVWADEVMPEEVGKPLLIYAYQVRFNLCQGRTLPLLVMRCSLDTDYDYIYKYPGEYVTKTCAIAFCGMI